ncbi:MAG: hypothetical protein KAH18_10830 [Psychromonas sp.]|nr:hypothetical protein [Psychromonas sp.]
MAIYLSKMGALHAIDSTFSCSADLVFHINKAEQLNISMVAYAKQNNISVQAFYCAKFKLLEKGAPSV